ncbi:polyketide synthase-like protein [Nemania diffusa]|nr:polyketide synthase-like protein [Nemania diffusa]
MARHGAKSIIACNRSGTTDEASARVVKSCLTYGCEITEPRGDVSDFNFVRRVFDSAKEKRIAGVIQGAMAIEGKVRGTRNPHRVSQSHLTMLSSISWVYRQSLGLAVNSVDLGAIEDVGYIAEQGSGLEARFDKKEWTPINEGTDASNPLNTRSAARCVTGVTFPLPNDGSSELTGSAHFRLSCACVPVGLRIRCRPAVPLKASVTLLSSQATKVLRLETGRGLVSRCKHTAQIRCLSWKSKLGAELSTLDITNARSLYALCEKAITKLPQAKETSS